MLKFITQHCSAWIVWCVLLVRTSNVKATIVKSWQLIECSLGSVHGLLGRGSCNGPSNLLRAPSSIVRCGLFLMFLCWHDLLCWDLFCGRFHRWSGFYGVSRHFCTSNYSCLDAAFSNHCPLRLHVFDCTVVCLGSLICCCIKRGLVLACLFLLLDVSFVVHVVNLVECLVVCNAFDWHRTFLLVRFEFVERSLCLLILVCDRLIVCLR